MTEYITKEQALEAIRGKMWPGEIEAAIKAVPPADVVPRGAYDQAVWERDLAIEQLRSYGVGLGEKVDVQSVVLCKDCKHSVPEDVTMDFCDTYECWYWGYGNPSIVKIDDFCKSGVKRND